MNTFVLHLQDATRYERIEGVSSFVGEDASGSFGILAQHGRFMTSLVFGLARFRVGKDAWHTEISIPWALLQLSPAEGGSFRMNVSRNRGNTTESWNTMAYHQPRHRVP